MREVFFCADEDNSQYIGLWLEARLFELRFVESGRRLSRPQLSPFHRSLLHFSAANNIRETPVPFQHHHRSGSKVFSFCFFTRGKSFMSPRESQDVMGNKSTGRFLLFHRLHAAAPEDFPTAPMFIQPTRTSHSSCGPCSCRLQSHIWADAA